MKCLLTKQLLAIFVPFVANFIVDGVRSWMGWIMVALLLALIIVPVIIIHFFLGPEQQAPTHIFDSLLYSEITLGGLYAVAWITTIVLAYTKWPKLF
jgi:hypothetical protein